MEVKEVTGLIVYLYSLRHVHSLKEYGRVYYVAKRMRYAVLYIDAADKQTTVSKLESLKYVKQVIVSHLNELLGEVTGKKGSNDDTFDDNLGE